MSEFAGAIVIRSHEQGWKRRKSLLKGKATTRWCEKEKPRETISHHHQNSSEAIYAKVKLQKNYERTMQGKLYRA